MAFDERELSEAEHAAELARELGCPHHVLLLRHTDALAELDQALASLDQPSADGVNTYFVSKAVRGAGIKVALSGLGGDELFAGYGYFRQFETSLRLAGCAPAGLARVLESPALLRLFGESPARAAKLGALLGGKRGPAGAYAALRCMFTPTQVDSLLAPGLRAGTEAAASDLSQGLTRADESRAYDPVPSFVARRHAGVGVAGGKLWVFGGLRGGTSADVVEEVLEALDEVRGLLAQANDGDFGALGGEGFGDGAADAAARPGDDGDFVLEFSHAP